MSSKSEAKAVGYSRSSMLSSSMVICWRQELHIHMCRKSKMLRRGRS
jgi:hypothetical protein